MGSTGMLVDEFSKVEFLPVDDPVIRIDFLGMSWISTSEPGGFGIKRSISSGVAVGLIISRRRTFQLFLLVVSERAFGHKFINYIDYIKSIIMMI